MLSRASGQATLQEACLSMAYLHTEAVTPSIPIAPMSAPPAPSQPAAVPPEAVVARMLEVFRGMELSKAQEAVHNTSGNHRNVDE